MFSLRLLILMFSIIVVSSIKVDYVDDTEEIKPEVNKSNASTEDARRTDYINAITTKTVKPAVSDNKNQSNENEKQPCIDNLCEVRNISEPTSVINGSKDKLTVTKKRDPYFSHDYEYQYKFEYDDDEDVVEVPLNETIEKLNVSNTFTTSTIVPTRTIPNENDFFNLDPFNPRWTIKDYEEDDNQDKWYIPESLPCWNLPLIYGELGRAAPRNEVFVLEKARLKNIYKEGREPVDGTKFAQAAHDLLVSSGNVHSNAKWCSVRPCYADHTLCLFSEAVNSKICDNEYVVSTPELLEQTAIISLINSMRNSVAAGGSKTYAHLPTATNMKQIIYDLDLERISKAWLHQCLPGPAPCSSLDDEVVTQLECTKLSHRCCLDLTTMKSSKCIPMRECFIPAIIGCIHAWFMSAGKQLDRRAVKCGHIEPKTAATTQILWAMTSHIGCAYSTSNNGDQRVVCNFSPGAPFRISADYYCGIIKHTDVTNDFNLPEDVTGLEFLESFSIVLADSMETESVQAYNNTKQYLSEDTHETQNEAKWGVTALMKLYESGWGRPWGNHTNGTTGYLARLVTEYYFKENSPSLCDTAANIYDPGEPASSCVETSWRYYALCYNFRDPTPGYRLVAVIAPVALFSLILYDLFSGVVRQTNY